MYGPIVWSPMTPHHTTHLRKSDVVSCVRQFHEDYHDPINGSVLYWGKIGLVGEQNVTNRLGVRVNPTAKLQPATRVR
jgi:hypothetical protein